MAGAVSVLIREQISGGQRLRKGGGALPRIGAALSGRESRFLRPLEIGMANVAAGAGRRSATRIRAADHALSGQRGNARRPLLAWPRGGGRQRAGACACLL